jgi:hypothetical protein
MTGLIDGSLSTLAPISTLALVLAVCVVALALVVLAILRWRFFGTSFLRSFASVALGVAIITLVAVALGSAAG